MDAGSEWKPFGPRVNAPDVDVATRKIAARLYDDLVKASRRSKAGNVSTVH